MKHTKEPLRLTSKSMSDGSLVVKDADHEIICLIRPKQDREPGPQDELDIQRGNRIVECVNACIGIEHPGEAIAAARETLKAVVVDLSFAGSAGLSRYDQERLNLAKKALELLGEKV